MDAGATAFNETPFDGVVMEDVARRANVSRALVYHYFPTKRDLFAAIWRRAHERLRADEASYDGRPLRDVVIELLTRHLEFYRTHAPLVMIANRSAIASDPAVREPIADGMRILGDRILDSADATGHERDLAATALTGWIAFVREVTVEWLVQEDTSQDEVVAMCMSVLDATIGTTVGWTGQ